MPTNPQRRTQILDTAIDILCDDGVGGCLEQATVCIGGDGASTLTRYGRL